MDEKQMSFFDAVAQAATMALCGFGVVVLVGAFARALERRDDEPEYVLTSRGNRILVEAIPDTPQTND